MFKHIKVEGTVPVVEDVTREFNRGLWTIGYTGQSPERLKLHMANQQTFDKTTLRANGGPCDGEYYGLPWPCWGTPEMKHPGTHVLYDTSKPISEGGMGFRARFGVERGGETLLAVDSYPAGSEIQDGYPEFTMALLQKLGWDKDLTADELAAVQKVGGNNIGAVNWKIDLSGGIQRVAIKHGCSPYGNAKARAVAWNFPDPVPIHREPLYTPRRDLVADYPTYQDTMAWRMPTLYKSIQDKDVSKDFPTILTSGRLVEYEGGGDETRSNPWLAELQQEMFVEINPVRRQPDRRQERRAGLGLWTRRRQGQGDGQGDRARRQRRRLHAVPFRRPFPGQGSPQQIPAGRRSLCARRERPTPHRPTAMIR